MSLKQKNKQNGRMKKKFGKRKLRFSGLEFRTGNEFFFAGSRSPCKRVEEAAKKCTEYKLFKASYKASPSLL
jgi:hypothetical protein